MAKELAKNGNRLSVSGKVIDAPILNDDTSSGFW